MHEFNDKIDRKIDALSLEVNSRLQELNNKYGNDLSRREDTEVERANVEVNKQRSSSSSKISFLKRHSDVSKSTSKLDKKRGKSKSKGELHTSKNEIKIIYRNGTTDRFLLNGTNRYGTLGQLSVLKNRYQMTLQLQMTAVSCQLHGSLTRTEFRRD